MKGRDFARLVREASTQAKQGGGADAASADKLRRLALTLASGAAPRMLDDDVVRSLQSFAIARVRPAVAPGLYGRFEELLRPVLPLLTPGQLASTYLNFSLVEHAPSRATREAYLGAATSVAFYDAAHLKQLYFAASRMSHAALATHVSGVILTGVREACDAAQTGGGGGGANAPAALDPTCPDALRSQVHALALHPRRALDAKQRALLRVWVETCWASLASLEDRVHALAGCERQGLRAADADGGGGDDRADDGDVVCVPLRATVAELCGPRPSNYTPQEAVVMLEACQGSPTLTDDAALLAALLAKAFAGVETPSLVRRALRPLAPLLVRPERVRAVLAEAARRLDPSSTAGGAGRLPALLHRRLRAAAAPDAVSRPALLLTLRFLRRAGVLEAAVPLDAAVAAFLSDGPSTPALWVDTADTMCLLLRAQAGTEGGAAAEAAAAAAREEIPRSSAAGVSYSDVGRAAVRAALAAWEAAEPPLSIAAGEETGKKGGADGADDGTGVTERQASLLMFACGVFGVAPPPRLATAVVAALGGGGGGGGNAAAAVVPAPLRTLLHAFHKLQMPVWVAAVAASPRFSAAAAAAALSRQEVLLVAEALVALPAALAAAGRNAGGVAALPALPQAAVCGTALAVAGHVAAVVEKGAGKKAAGGPAFEVAEAACFLRLFGGGGGGAAAAAAQARALVLRDLWSSPGPVAAEAGLVLARCLPRPADAGEAAQCARWFGTFSARAGAEAVALKQMLLLRASGGGGGGSNNDGDTLTDEDLRRSNVLLPMMAAHLSPRLLPPACPRVAALEHLGDLAAAAAARAAAVGAPPPPPPQRPQARRPPSLVLRVAGALRRQTSGQRSWDAQFVRSLGKNPLVWRHAWASASVAADDAGAKAGLLEPAFMVALRFATCAAAAEAGAGAGGAAAPLLGTALARALVPRLSAATEAEAAPSPLVRASGGVELLEVSLALLAHSAREEDNGLEPLLLRLAERRGWWWWSDAAGDAYWTWVRGVSLCSRTGSGGSARDDFRERFAACVVATASADVGGGGGGGDAVVALRAVSALVSVGAPPETFALLREGWRDASAVKSLTCNDKTLLSLLGASAASVRTAHARLRRQGGVESEKAALAADELLVEVFGAVVAGALAATEKGLAQRLGCLVAVLEALDAAAIEAPAEALRKAVTASVEQAVRAAAPGTEPDTREAGFLRKVYQKHGGADKLTLHMLALCPTRKRLGKHCFRTLVATKD